MPKVYKKIQAAESAPPPNPNRSQKGGGGFQPQASSSNLNTTSAPAEPAFSGNSRFGSYLNLAAFSSHAYIFSSYLIAIDLRL